MIVKNESAILHRLLQSVLPLIDSYCICDTGSTDDTIEIIETFFRDNNLPGIVVEEPFQDFGYNRTFALQQCANLENADYLLLLDADMVLKFGPTFSVSEFKASLTKDAYHIFQGSDVFFYKNVRILKNNPEFSYWGVTHEYVKTLPTSTYEDIDKIQIFIEDIGDGGSKTNKFLRDIELLKRGLEELPDNDRYLFYLANSYKDSCQYENAIETYKKRIDVGGWIEETWFSYYCIGKCYKELGQIEMAIHFWMEGYQHFPQRVENLYEIVHYYRTIGKNELAYTFYELADFSKQKYPSTDHLFLQKDIYDYKLDYEFSIIGYYCNRHNKDIPISCMRALANPNADDSTQKNVLSNYKFYAPALKEFAVPNPKLSKLTNIQLPIDKSEFVSSTPSVVIESTSIKKSLVVNTRFVNYRIGDDGSYINKDKIVTKNVISVYDIESKDWLKTAEFELKYDEGYDNIYVGLEDVRLFSKFGQLQYNANRGLSGDTMVIENGVINTKSNGTISSLVKKEGQRKIEKNWVLFRDHRNETKMVYEWHPLTLGIHRDHPDRLIDGNNRPITQFHPTHSIPTPSFFKWVRGSTNGIPVGNEIWFICHVVSYEDRRYYYHILVALDNKTYTLLRYSRLFTFEKEKVEYTLGFVYFETNNEFLIGYSVMDRETKFMQIPRSTLENLFLP
jgi:tetratricopeptide (TPR) repeat protein